MKHLIIVTLLLTKYAIAVEVDDIQSVISVDRRLVGPKSSKVFNGKGSKSKSRSQSTTSTKSFKATSDELSKALNSSTLGEELIQIPLSSVEIGNATNATTAKEDLGIGFSSEEVDVTEEDLNLYLNSQKSRVIWKRNLAVSAAGVVALLAGAVAVTTINSRRRRAEIDSSDNDVLDSDEISPSKDADDTTDYFGDLFGLTNWWSS